MGHKPCLYYKSSNRSARPRRPGFCPPGAGRPDCCRWASRARRPALVSWCAVGGRRGAAEGGVEGGAGAAPDVVPGPVRSCLRFALSWRARSSSGETGGARLGGAGAGSARGSRSTGAGARSTSAAGTGALTLPWRISARCARRWRVGGKAARAASARGCACLAPQCVHRASMAFARGADRRRGMARRTTE